MQRTWVIHTENGACNELTGCVCTSRRASRWRPPLARSLASVVPSSHTPFFPLAFFSPCSLSSAGVRGYRPIFDNSNRVFQYMSHVNLGSPSCRMGGFYTFEGNNNRLFHVPIPEFRVQYDE